MRHTGKVKEIPSKFPLVFIGTEISMQYPIPISKYCTSGMAVCCVLLPKCDVPFTFHVVWYK